MREKIILIGSSGHARVVIDIIEEEGKYQIEGVVTNDIFPDGKFNNYTVLGDDSVLHEMYKAGYKNLAMGVGGFKNNLNRKKIFNNLKATGFNFINVIHPKSVISRSVKIGEGCTIFAGVIINPNAIIRNNVIIATNATIDHDSIIESHVLISAGVTVGGNDLIGEGTLLALGSKVVSGIKIGKNILIGSGAVVVKDCLEEGLYLGIPAKLIKK